MIFMMDNEKAIDVINRLRSEILLSTPFAHDLLIDSNEVIKWLENSSVKPKKIIDYHYRFPRTQSKYWKPANSKRK